MEWQTWKNSTLNGPIWTVSPAFTGRRSALDCHSAAGEFDLDQAEGQGRSVNRRRDAVENVLNGPDMIFMSVRDHNPDDFIDFCHTNIQNQG